MRLVVDVWAKVMGLASGVFEIIIGEHARDDEK